MIGYPLDSHVEYDTDGTPIYDRAISSAPMRKLYKKLFSDGVLPNPSTNMQVSAGDGMNVIVYPGFAMCNGCMKLEEAQRTLAVQASSAAYDRIDTVVLRLNDNDSERICDFYILQGTPAVSPVRPELTRTESIWELGLADLFIAKNSTVISNQRITDTRYETARCGVMSSISEFDSDTIYQQVQADLAGFKAEEQADFIAWFEEIQGQLSEDAAGNLQNQIGTLPSLVTEVKTNIVAAINWVAEKLSALASMIGTSDISTIGDGTVTGAIASQNVTLTNINTDLPKTYPLIGGSGTLSCLIVKNKNIVTINCSGNQSTAVSNPTALGTVSADLIPNTPTGYIRCGTALTAPPSAAATDKSFPISAQVSQDGKLIIANDYGDTMYCPQFVLTYSVD